MRESSQFKSKHIIQAEQIQRLQERKIIANDMQVVFKVNVRAAKIAEAVFVL